MNPQEKFRYGKDLSPNELMGIPLIDRCRYVVDKYFKNGFSAGEVHSKLVELNNLHELFTPMEVHNALVEFYGRP